jgi:cell division protein FtsB
LLQSAYSDYQIGPLENLHQPVKNAPLVVLGARLKVYFQYLLRFADRLKS